MKRKSHSLSAILAAVAVVLIVAWPQVSYSQFGKFAKIKIKVPTIDIPQLSVPVIGAGIHGYNGYRKVQEELQRQRISDLKNLEAYRKRAGDGILSLPDVKVSVPSFHVPTSQEVRDFSQRETLYARGVDAYLKGDSAKFKSLLRRSSDAMYAPAQYLYALTLLNDESADKGEAVDLLIRSAFSGGYAQSYYALYLYERQYKPVLAKKYLKESANKACFDALVTAGFMSWEEGDTLDAADCWQTAYRKERQMDSVLTANGKKNTAEYCRTLIERSASVVGDQLPAMYANLLWVKYAAAQTPDDHLDCIRLCEYIEAKQYTSFADWIHAEYYRGYGDALPVDYAEAVRHLRVAAAAYPGAKTALASMYYQGTGCERDSVYAAKLYEEAASDGSVEAIDMMARMCFDAKQWAKVVEWGTRPQLADSLEIQYLVGLAYVFNDECKKSLDCFIRAADAGNVDAMWMTYVVSDGIAPGDPKAMKYLEMAADSGNAEALNALGYCYACGRHVGIDVTKAMQLFGMARDAGCVDAYNNIGMLYYDRAKVAGRRLDRRLAAAYWREGTEKGDPYSMYNYALLQIKGRGGIKKDKSQGYLLMRRAADLGVEEAKDFFGKL